VAHGKQPLDRRRSRDEPALRQFLGLRRGRRRRKGDARSRCGESVRGSGRNAGKRRRPGSDQLFPFITLASERIDVCFQDRRYAPGNALLFTTCAFSTDGGLSFTNQQVTTTGFDASNNSTFIGDYNMQASTSKAVSPIFVGDGVPGGDSSAMEVFVARVTP
jgi:hypothetical protein